MPGKLYIVATPIGNLEDVTLRAINVLSDADIILTEDTRISKRLVQKYNITTPLLSYHQHSSVDKKQTILELLLEGKNVALITDAGTPGISDPGNELIEYIRERGELEIISIPGASSITAALSVSGFPTNRFVFLGFLPKKKREKLFNWLKEGEKSSGVGGGITFAYFESPYRLIKSLISVKDHFGPQTTVFIARELTKLHETLYWGSVKSLIDKLEKEKVRGEVVVVVRP